MRRPLSHLLSVAAATAVVLGTPVTAGAAPRAIGVSVPADPIHAVPGHWAELPLRVTNPGPTTVTIEIQSRALELGDNGRISVLTNPDPRWEPHLQVPPGPIDVPAQGYVEVSINLAVPRVAPDTYLVGFLVTPVVKQSGVQVVNAIGTYFAIDVPGPRDRRLAASLSVPTFVWGNSTRATVTATNLGRSSLSFWGESGAQHLAKMFLPVARHRSVSVTNHSHLGIGTQTVTVHLFYNGTTDAEVRQANVSGTTFFVSPAYLLAAAIGLLTLAGLLVRRRIRQSAAHRTKSRSAGRESPNDTRPARHSPDLDDAHCLM